MRRNKVRGRDGAIREVSDGYVLRDGETQVVELPFMDAKIMVTDARGQPAEQRPGFLLSDTINEQARADAYAAYDQAISERWRGPQTKPLSKPAQVFDSPESAVAAAYVEYADAIQQRWRK